MRVLDTSAFTHKYHVDGKTASIPLIEEELTGEHIFRFGALEGAGMHVRIPGQGTADKMLRAAGETGGRDTLSEANTRPIAAVFELDATLVTGGYVIRNAVEQLNVGVEVIAQDGIVEQRTWKFRRQGYDREFDENKKHCPICGMELSRKNSA